MKNIINTQTGNHITNNALSSDDGVELIKTALQEIENKIGWWICKEEKIFSGVYFDSKKVGSFITKIKNNNKETAVLKLQLRPLPYDEGFIIRHIQKYKKSDAITIPRIIKDEPWNESNGYGYLIFEDFTHLPNLWLNNVTDENDRNLHAKFLKEFITKMLPVPSWLKQPDISQKKIRMQTFDHFFEIAQASAYHHIDPEIVMEIKKKYFEVINKIDLGDLHFTHGHMSGKDIKYDSTENKFILFANLYWSYRPEFYEFTFPIWVDIMHIEDKKVTLYDLIQRINDWIKAFSQTLPEYNFDKSELFWLGLLERSALVVMLDLGSSEWKSGTEEVDEALLNSWKDLFYWIIDNKLK